MSERSLEPRKTPRQSRAVMTFEAIVQAATRILSAGGLDAFNTNAVAERAGVSIGSLYQYFPDKDVLMAEIIRADNRAFRDALRAAAGSAAAPHEALSALIGVAVAHQFDDPGLARIIDREQARLPLLEEDRVLRGEIVDVLVDVLTRLDPAPADPARAALDLLGIARGLIDNTALAGGVGADEVRTSLERAAFGYLGIMPGGGSRSGTRMS